MTSSRAQSPPRVSCVMIFLDGAAYIDEAIASVCGQIGLDDWELILVDDGSTDGSTEIAQQWCARDPGRIHYIDHPEHANAGMSASRNLGVSIARGTFIGFLDCDDVWLPLHLARRLDVAAVHPSADVIIGGTWRWYSWTGEAADRRRDHRMDLPAEEPFSVVAPPDLFAGIYATPGRWNVPAMCSLLIRRTALMSIGGSSKEFRGLHEDQVLYAKITLGLRVVIDPRPLSLYRQHPKSTCAVSESSGIWHPNVPSLIEGRFLSWMQHYVQDIGTTDRRVLSVVERNLAHHTQWSQRSPLNGSAALQLIRTRLLDTARRHARRGKRMIRRFRPRDDHRSIPGGWTSQAAALMAAIERGDVLVIGSASDRPVRWIDRVPGDAFPNAVRVESTTLHECAHEKVEDESERFDLIVVLSGATADLDPDAVLSTTHRRLRSGGHALLLFGARDERPDSPAALPVTRSRLEQLGHRWFPDDRVRIEPFGNRLTATCLRTDTVAADEELGSLVDQHSPAFEVFFAMIVQPAVLSAELRDPGTARNLPPARPST